MRFGDYEVVSEIGRGGMGVVYLARSASGREVALKVLPGTSSEEAFARFDRERELQSSLGEAEGFVPLLDSGERTKEPWLVMPFVSGGSLRDRLRRGPLAEADAIALGHSLARALGAAHARGIVHRDLKPENVLFTPDGRALVADLGVAKRFDALGGESRTASLSRSGTFVGTVGYLAPEQLVAAKAVGPPADVFALGAILYECLAGKPAFQGEGFLELCARAAQGQVEPLARARPGASPSLVRVVEKALSPDAAARFEDGAAMARALSALEASAPAPSRGKTPVVLAAVFLALACAGIGGAFTLSWLEDGKEEERRKDEELAARARKREEEEKRRKDEAAAAAEKLKQAEAVARKEEARKKAQAALAEAKLAMERRDLDAAIEASTRATELDPTFADAFERLGYARLGKQDYERAIKDFDRAIELDPRMARAFVDRGNARGAIGDLDGCIADFTKAIEIEPGNVIPWTNRGNAHCTKREWQDAIDDYSRAIELAPTFPNCRKGRAIARENAGDAPGAIADYERFLEIAPDDPQAEAARATIERLRGR